MRKLLKKNRIKGIEPFNELYFKDCFFTLLFSIIIHYKKNIDPIIANESIFYENNDDKSIIRVGYEPIKDYKNVLLNIGIHVTNKITKNDFVPNIITSISENKPVIVLVDCYFEPMIMDAYKKKHLLHSALIYGYGLSLYPISSTLPDSERSEISFSRDALSAPSPIIISLCFTSSSISFL